MIIARVALSSLNRCSFHTAEVTDSNSVSPTFVSCCRNATLRYRHFGVRLDVHSLQGISIPRIKHGVAMHPSKSPAPVYRYHLSGNAQVTLCGKDFYLGPHGSPESYSRYQALRSTLSQWCNSMGGGQWSRHMRPAVTRFFNRNSILIQSYCGKR